ncbi:MAG: hypothetical protein Q9222_004113 [Ikaeria aurantiellina]
MVPKSGAVKSYQSPSRVNAAQAYPVPSPDGSTVILLGNENGLRISWWRNESSKAQDDHLHARIDRKRDDNPSVDNDNDDDANFSISPYQGIQSDVESESYEHLPQSLNLSLGTGVLRIAVPSVHPTVSQLSNGSYPMPLSDKLVAALVCSDSSIRLLTLPLYPSSTAQKRKGNATSIICTDDGRVGPCGEQMVIVSSGHDHQSIPKCVSSTPIHPAIGRDTLPGIIEDDYRSAREWSTLVASASSDLSGIVLIHRLPLTPDGRKIDLTAASNKWTLWSVHRLPSPAISLQFSPSMSQLRGHSTLLAAEASGSVRLLQLPSAEAASQCLWTVILIPKSPSSDTVPNTTRTVLDARWVLDGKAILVLSADGEWGIWALEDPGYKIESMAHRSRVPRLGSLTTFAIGGHAGAGPDPSTVDMRNRKANGKECNVKLAPTTPSTRRARQGNLFAGSYRDRKGAARGCISIDRWQNGNSVDEAVLLWHNDSIVLIRSLRTHWAGKAQGPGNILGAGPKGKVQIISNKFLKGETSNHISVLPSSHRTNISQPSSIGVLITEERRITVVAA